jgi:hypothetical protein
MSWKKKWKKDNKKRGKESENKEIGKKIMSYPGIQPGSSCSTTDALFTNLIAPSDSSSLF